MDFIIAGTRENRKKTQNTCLYIFNIAMAAIISLKVFALTMSVSAGLIVWLSGNGSITRWAKLIPEWMQFIRIEGLEHITPEINLVVFASLFFAAVITAFTVCMLYQMQKNSEKRGEIKCQLKILESLNQEKKQTITYLIGKGTSGDQIYVALEKEHRDGCIVQSKTGKKIVTLKYITTGQNNDYEYEVVGYQNTKKPEITKESFRKDFFGEEESTRDDVTVWSPTTAISILSDVVFETYSKNEEIKSPPLPEIKGF